MKNTVLIALISALLMELTLRAIGFSYVQFYGPDPLMGWSGRPGAGGVYREEGIAEIRISSAGVRDRERAVAKPAGVWRVAVLGDSNCGISGFGTAQQYVLLKTVCFVTLPMSLSSRSFRVTMSPITCVILIQAPRYGHA
jgi:hypothetical protein